MPKTRASKNKDEMPTLTREDFARAASFKQYPAAVKKAIAEQRGARPTLPVAIPLSRDVIQGLRATGRGWQKRADDALRDWLKQQPKAKARDKAAA